MAALVVRPFRQPGGANANSYGGRAMPVVKRARYEAVCDMCDRQNGSVEYTSKRETRQAVQKEGWEVDGDALYCEYCATRAGWRCQGCNLWYPARPAYTSCATCDKAAEARWMRGGDGSHWDGCYASHWDCAIRELRAALDDAADVSGERGKRAGMEHIRTVYLGTGNG